MTLTIMGLNIITVMQDAVKQYPLTWVGGFGKRGDSFGLFGWMCRALLMFLLGLMWIESVSIAVLLIIVLVKIGSKMHLPFFII